MKEVLYICVKNPFCQRDMERMGIEFLERMFDVQILDCTEWLMPRACKTRGPSTYRRANLYRIATLCELKKLIGKQPGGLAIDYVGQFSVPAVLLFHALKKNGTQIVIVDSGAYPSPDLALGKRPLVMKVIDAYRHGVFGQMFKEKCVKWLLKILPDQSPDFAFVAGQAWRGDLRFRSAANHIPAHSFDYEVYRAHRSAAEASATPYAVYLDETIAGHEDNAELGLPEPASAMNFYPALRRFFDDFEATTGLPVVIAAYPSADIEACQAYFGGRKILKGQTAELVRDSTLVFAHASTAISYAVLWRKPLAFLTSGEITGGWYQPWIDAPRVLLNASLFNLDDRLPAASRESWLHLDHDAYSRYETWFIKSEDSPDVSLWERFEVLRTNRSVAAGIRTGLAA